MVFKGKFSLRYAAVFMLFSLAVVGSANLFSYEIG